ncbi:uncharacterized protein LOC130773145 isoform X2 [Actinidia eriantha]|uniref:uncharacterized protein LOC130773145 isoform X2 n=1 Tax=Actinidia eriantha TaxID=165200 RepID=UPI002586D9B2|nr:uncharacterized protein LOC130773145 isoform X2 [Actinidia eriantha]
MARSGTVCSHSITINRSAAFRAALNWNADSLSVISDFLRHQPQGLTQLDVQGNTILHFLALDGNANALRQLFEGGLLTNQDLRTGNSRGDTVLHEAARFGKRDVAEMILDKEKDLLSARNNLGETPLYTAAASGTEEVFDLLQANIGREEVILRRDDGCTVLHAAVTGEHYSLALEIMDIFSNLALAHDKNGNSALHVLAKQPLSFKSGSSYSLTNIGCRPFIPLQFLRCLVYLCIPSQVNMSKFSGDVEDPRQNGRTLSQSKRGLVEKLITVAFWLRGFDEVKQKHALALELAKRLIAKQEDWSQYTNCEHSNFKFVISGENNRMRNPLMVAAENSIQELVEKILKKFPDAAYTIDGNGKNIFHIAVEQKDEKMYEFLKRNVRRDGMVEALDNEGNTILHLATKKGNSPRVLLGHLNQMAWDVCWLKRVWYDSPPHFQYIRNSDGKTASEIFEENHSDLRENAEKALKDMNSSLMLTSALIGTVNYAAVFTIPGGIDQDRKSPYFSQPILYHSHNEKDLLLFLWYTGVGLFSSLLALVAMIGIQLSRFCSNDFYMALPFRFVAALTSLLVSTIFTITACFKAYNILDIKFNINVFMGPAFYVLCLIYFDTVYLTLKCMYFALCGWFSYRGQEMSETSELLGRGF